MLDSRRQGHGTPLEAGSVGPRDDRLRMRTLSESWSLSAVAFLLSIKILQAVRRVRPPREDGWRRAARAFLKTEPSSFALATMGLGVSSGETGEDVVDIDTSDPRRAADAVARRLAAALAREPAFRRRMVWNRWGVRIEETAFTDVAWVEYASDGTLVRLTPYLSGSDHAASTPAMQAAIGAVVDSFNAVLELPDGRRERALADRVGRRLRNTSSLSPTERGEALRLGDRLLAATYLCFDLLPSDSPVDRAALPESLRWAHPGQSCLRFHCRFHPGLECADLWVESRHVPWDGMLVAEFMDSLKVAWGRPRPFVAPPPGSTGSRSTLALPARGRRPPVKIISEFLDFAPLLATRHEISTMHGDVVPGGITLPGLVVWGLAQHEVFEGRKFLVPIDLTATRGRERTLGVIYIRPATFARPGTTLGGFLDFQAELNRRVSVTRDRTGEWYALVETFAVVPPVVHSLSLSLLPGAIERFVGTTGITVIRTADLFVAPMSAAHVEGYVSLGSVHVPTADGRTAGSVCVKAFPDRADAMMEAMRDVARGGPFTG